jgi:hypothetical protein
MAEKQVSASLVQKLTLLVLLLILGCLGAILYKLSQPPAPPIEAAAPPLVEPAVEASEPPTATSTNLLAPVRVPGPPPAPVRPVVPRPPVPPPPPVEAAREAPAPMPAVAFAPVAAATAPVMVPATAVAESVAPLVFEALPVGSEMRIEGDSTLHKWHCLGKIISGKFEAEPGWLTSPSLALAGSPSAKCEIKIPIRTLKSQVSVGASVMDNRMQTEMKANRFPNIEYRLASLGAHPVYATTNDAVDLTGPLVLRAVGDLAISGVTNRVTFPLAMHWVGTNALKFVGKYSTRMTAFGIKPPEFTVLGQGVKTADDITLTWTWLVGLKPAAVAGR